MAWLNKIEKAYLAGIMDGEGSIGITKRKIRKRGITPEYRARLRITNVSKELMNFIEDKIKNQGSYYICERKNRAPNRKTIYELEMGDRLTVKFLKEVLPYLIIKKRHAENVIELKNTFNIRYRPVPSFITEIREKCFLFQKELNRRGLLLG